jgi:serine/threonine protein kinase
MSTTRKELPEEKETKAFEPVVKEQMPQSGDHLGYCRVIESIAAGGMANVYKVWHEQLEVVRAVKILKPGFDEESKSRLETEAKISANLRHPNIVEIYGMGYWNSIPYIEMEYVDGPSLKELLEKNGRLPIPFSLALTHSLCVALQFAHNQDLTLYGKIYDGLIHRDIKPANILVSSKGIIKLADFGIAKPSDFSLHTVGGKVMGTFAYLSPEQLNGEKLDQRCDIYALGTVLYEMLTGTKTYPQKMLAELIHRKTKSQYIPVGSLHKDVPKPICAAVDKSLTLDINKRYQDASEFDNELTSALKKISNRTFDEITKDYISNPFASPKTSRSFKSGVRVLSIVIIVLFVAASLTGVYLLDRYGERLFKDPQIVTTDKMPLPPIPKVDTINTLNSLTRESPKKVEPQKETAENQIEKALSTFKSGDYSSAIALFENITTEHLNTQEKEARAVYLLHSYIKNGDIDKALSYSDSGNCTDGYFYFLRGEQLYQRNLLEKAEDAFKKARTMHTQFDKNTSRNASLFLARIRDGMYLLKPNIDNKQLCIRAWSTFLDIFCLDDDQSQECSEAREKIASFETKLQ